MAIHSMINKLLQQIQSGGEFSFIVRWLLNPGEAPRQNVRLSVADGVISDICDCPYDERLEVLPIAMMPRLFNAHTHLEFSHLSEPCLPSQPFTDWIHSVMRSRGESDDRQKVIDTGVRESIHSGVAVVGEISTCDEDILIDSRDLRAVQFREMIGLDSDVIDGHIETARNHLIQPGCRKGLSPHAPYSVHPDLFETLVELAAERQAPVAMHLAETLDEVELLESGTGRFVDFLRELGLWHENLLKPGSSALDYLKKLATLRHAQAVHGNYLNDRELTFLCDHPNVALTYCPRTHHFFGHWKHPWQQLVKNGATVTIGTDSRASNPDLSVWKELQFLSNQSETLPWPELLRLATINAANALGLADIQTAIASESRFDAVFVPCDAQMESQLANVLSFPECQPVLVVAAGDACSVNS